MRYSTAFTMLSWLEPSFKAQQQFVNIRNCNSAWWSCPAAAAAQSIMSCGQWWSPDLLQQPDVVASAADALQTTYAHEIAAVLILAALPFSNQLHATRQTTRTSRAIRPAARAATRPWCQKLQVQLLEDLSQIQFFLALGAAASAAENPLKARTSLATSLLPIHNRGGYAVPSSWSAQLKSWVCCNAHTLAAALLHKQLRCLLILVPADCQEDLPSNWLTCPRFSKPTALKCMLLCKLVALYQVVP